LPLLCQNGGLSVLSPIRETETRRVGGGRQSCCFLDKRSPGEEGSVKRSVVAKFQCVVFAHFHAFAVRCRGNMWNWVFGPAGRIFCEQSPLCQEKMMSMLLTLFFTCLASLPRSSSHSFRHLYKI
jgi:hypothetical protein